MERLNLYCRPPEKTTYEPEQNRRLKRNTIPGSTISTLLHDKNNPKNCQVLSLGDSGFLQFFRVVSRDDMAVPPLNYPLFLLEIRKIPLESDNFEVLQTLNFGGLNTEIIQSPHFEGLWQTLYTPNLHSIGPPRENRTYTLSARVDPEVLHVTY